MSEPGAFTGYLEEWDDVELQPYQKKLAEHVFDGGTFRVLPERRPRMVYYRDCPDCGVQCRGH